MTYHGKRHSGPWYQNQRELLLFEWGVRAVIPSLGRRIAGAGLTYSLSLDVPYYETREVTILFRPGYERPVVTVDGPPESPHRYSGGDLCMWYHKDPETQRWVRGDKLLALVGIIARHLFKEAWWRETGEWLGLAVGHGQKTENPDKEQR